MPLKPLQFQAPILLHFKSSRFKFFVYTCSLFMCRPAFHLISAPVILWIAALSCPADPLPTASRHFDLRQCYELALQRGETVGLSDAEIAAAQARYWNSVGPLFPQIHLLAEQRWQNSNSGSSSGGTAGSSSVNSRFLPQLNLQVPLFTGFRQYYTAAANKADLEAQRFNKKRQLQNLYLDVADVYYQNLAYQQDLRVLDEVRQTLEDRVVELQKWVKLGKSRLGDLRAAEVDRSNALVLIEQSKGLLASSRELLAFLINFPENEWDLVQNAPFPGADKLEFYLAQTGERPDVLATLASDRAERKRLSAARGERLPSITLNSDYYAYEHPQNNEHWDLFLTFDLPLFDGGQIEAKISEQKANVRHSELNLQQLQRSAQRDVRTAYSDFISASAQVVKLTETGRLAEDNYHLQQQDYRYGIVTNLDVLTALRNWLDTRRALISADRDARVALVRLHVAAGMEAP